MTQAYNLAILANAVNTSGQLNVGTNATGVLPLANGGTGTTNTVNTVVAGTGISVSTSGTQVTVTNTSSATGTVSSVATGNGLQGGTITTTGTLSVACPGFNTVGSYCFALIGDVNNNSNSYSSGSNYSAGGGLNQLGTATIGGVNDGMADNNRTYSRNLSGTWKWMSAPSGPGAGMGVACRVS